MSILKASGLSELLKEYDINVTPKNIGRFTKNYEIKKDPSRPSQSGFYLKPSEAQLEKIKKQYDLNLLKQGQSEPSQKRYKEKYDKALDLLKQGKTQSEVSRILGKQYNYNTNQGPRGFVSTAAEDLKKEGFKVKSGREAEQGLSKILQDRLKQFYPDINFEFDKYKYGVTSENPKYSSIKNAAGAFQEYLKERVKNIQEVSSLPAERKIIEAKKNLSKELGLLEKGETTLDLAHRTSLKQNKEVGLSYLSSNLGIDPQEVNRKIIKPIESELKTLYKQQNKLVNQAKKFDSVPKEIQQKLSDVNFKISEVIATTDGRLQGIHVDEKTLQPKRTGIDYSKSVDLGIFNKPVKDLSKQEIEFINKLILPEAMKSQIDSIPGTLKKVASEIIPGTQALTTSFGNYLSDLATELKAGKVLSPTLKVLGTAAIPLTVYDAYEGYTEGLPLDEVLLKGLLGAEGISQSFKEQSALSPKAREAKQVLSANTNLGMDSMGGMGYIQAPSTMTEQEAEKIYTPEAEAYAQKVEQENLARREDRGKVLNYIKERFSPFANEEPIQMKDGGFVEFGDPETWGEKAQQFINRPTHERPIESTKSNMYGKYSTQLTDSMKTKPKELEPLSKYKSYSELEILSNLSAKNPNTDILEENILDVMPEYSPLEVVPKGSKPVMPNIYDERREGILNLANGGIVVKKN